MGQGAPMCKSPNWSLCTCRSNADSEGEENIMAIASGASEAKQLTATADDEDDEHLPENGSPSVSPRGDAKGFQALRALTRSSHSLSSEPMKNDLAKRRLKGAIAAVKAANRMAKQVRFSDESVFVFEVNISEPSEGNSLNIGDQVSWADFDDDVPKGCIGVVQGFGEKGTVQVKFTKGTWDFKATELRAQESWASRLATEAVAKSEGFMRDYSVLEAEAALMEALERLQEVVALPMSDLVSTVSGVSDSSGSRSHPSVGSRRASNLEATDAAEAKKVIARLCGTAIWKVVEKRIGEYETFATSLVPTGYRLVWERDKTQFWVRADAGATWFEYRIVSELDARLSECLAYINETDLRPKYESLILGTPRFAGPMHPVRVEQPVVMSIMMLKVQMVLEVLRWYDCTFGWYGESVQSKASSLHKSAYALHSQRLWIPRGGSAKGTVAVEITRVDTGGRLTKWMLDTFVNRIATRLAAEQVLSVARVSKKGSQYIERIAQDEHGLYEELAKVEAAAAERQSISAASLPGPEFFERPRKMTGSWP